MNRATIRKLYREAIVTEFGCDDPDGYDKQLLKSVKTDIHLGDKAPGQWSPGSVLEIYCENGIPNATDMFDPAWHGFSGEISYNSERWCTVDGIVNLMLEAMGEEARVRHEPYNSAVVNVYWNHK